MNVKIVKLEYLYKNKLIFVGSFVGAKKMYKVMSKTYLEQREYIKSYLKHRSGTCLNDI